MPISPRISIDNAMNHHPAMQDFVFQGLSSRVVFGWNALKTLPEEMQRLGITRALVLTTPEQEVLGREVTAQLGANAVGVYPKAVMHVPVEVAANARLEAARLQADGYLALGGGSTIGLGKAIALESGLPIIAVPTTYAGSEMTPIYGLTEGRVKRTGRDAKVLPRTVIYDPALTLGLPPALSAASGINAIAHAVEALYAVDTNPIINLMAEESICTLARALPHIMHDPENRNARADALYGAWLAGACLGSVSMALHHKLCHTLGGTLNLPHAQTHAVMLPHTAHYNHRAAAQALTRVARALGGTDAAEAGTLLFALNQSLGLPLSLQALGATPEGMIEAARLAAANPYPNPEPIGHDRVLALLQRAYAGERP